MGRGQNSRPRAWWDALGPSGAGPCRHARPVALAAPQFVRPPSGAGPEPGRPAAPAGLVSQSVTQASVLGSGHSQPSPSVSLRKGRHSCPSGPSETPTVLGPTYHGDQGVWGTRVLLCGTGHPPACSGTFRNAAQGHCGGGANAEQEA